MSKEICYEISGWGLSRINVAKASVRVVLEGRELWHRAMGFVGVILEMPHLHLGFSA